MSLDVSDILALGADGGLSDTDLQTVLDREEALLIAKFGPYYSATTPLVETVTGGGRSLFLKRPITSITSVVEYAYIGDTAPVTLTTADYFIWTDEGRLERVQTASRWGAYAIVTYTPKDDTELRDSVLIELIRLAVTQDTGGSVSGLGFSISGSVGGARDYQTQRAALYARLGWLSR